MMRTDSGVKPSTALDQTPDISTDSGATPIGSGKVHRTCVDLSLRGGTHPAKRTTWAETDPKRSQGLNTLNRSKQYQNTRKKPGHAENPAQHFCRALVFSLFRRLLAVELSLFLGGVRR